MDEATEQTTELAGPCTTEMHDFVAVEGKTADGGNAQALYCRHCGEVRRLIVPWS